jgi:hypothetical protein
MVDERLETAGDRVQHQIEAIGGTTFEPADDRVRDLLMRADQEAMTAAHSRGSR